MKNLQREIDKRKKKLLETVEFDIPKKGGVEGQEGEEEGRRASKREVFEALSAAVR